jgi:hypothetical protein
MKGRTRSNQSGFAESRLIEWYRASRARRWGKYMLQGSCTQRQVKEAVALADKLKDGPFDLDGFKKKLAEVQNELRSLSEYSIDESHFKDHQNRLRRINEGHWALGVVELENCLTWPQFGGRKWIEAGPVNVTADSVRNHNDPTDRLWEMVKHVHLYVVNLPLVVIRINKNPTTFYIDDGAHRAVAYYLAGFREAFAYIGAVKEDINHKWEWQAWKT